MVRKARITFVINKALRNDLREKIVKDNYSLREKSKWTSEAIELLLNMCNYPDLVNLGSKLNTFDNVETIIIESFLKKKLEDAAIKIRQKYPLLEGVQSGIVRTAIIQRLLR